MKTYSQDAESSNLKPELRPSWAELRYLAAKLELLAQDLHRGPIPSTHELVVDDDYGLGRSTGYEMGTGTSLVLAGLVHSLRRVAAHRRSATQGNGEQAASSPSIYPVVSSAVEGGDQS